jgi:hypothetical protein
MGNGTEQNWLKPSFFEDPWAQFMVGQEQQHPTPFATEISASLAHQFTPNPPTWSKQSQSSEPVTTTATPPSHQSSHFGFQSHPLCKPSFFEDPWQQLIH